MTKQQKADQEEARAKLREILKPGDKVSTILRHVSASGMSRSISLYFTKDGENLDITYWAARAMGDKIDQKNGGIKAGGCGMDMGFSLVYNLGFCLWPDGFTCTGNDYGPGTCRSNDHSNGDRSYAPHHHKDGGYALRQVWM